MSGNSEVSRIERLHYRNLADYHVHCDFSIDAVGSVDDYCQAALMRGLVEICFTSHYDTNPNSDGRAELIRIGGEDKPAVADNLQPYVDAVLQARDKYFGLGLSVKLGLEFGWYPGCEEEAQKVRDRYEFEHFLCGIHEIENVCFCCAENYEKCLSRYTVDQVAKKYADDIVAAADSGLFSAIAHLDYIRKFGLKFYGPALDDRLLREAEERIFPALVRSDTPLEVNTSAMRRGMNDYHPRLKLINAARRAGVQVHYLGSDAHAPEQVGYDFDAAAPLAGMTAAHCSED